MATELTFLLLSVLYYNDLLARGLKGPAVVELPLAAAAGFLNLSSCLSFSS